MAVREGWQCHALSVDYGQRHRAELDAAAAVARALGAAGHRVVRVDLGSFGGSALTDRAIAVPTAPSAGIPVTYVPARNTILLSLALAWAEVLEADAIFTGANAVDYSGYPDCRPEFLRAFEALARVATVAGAERNEPLRIHAPLLEMTKRDIVLRGRELGVDFALTHTCYDPVVVGGGTLACGRCDACILRLKGFAEAHVTDPVPYAS